MFQKVSFNVLAYFGTRAVLARQNSSLLHCCFHKLFLKLQEPVLRLLDKIGFYQISGRHFTVLNVSKPQKKICSRKHKNVKKFIKKPKIYLKRKRNFKF